MDDSDTPKNADQPDPDAPQWEDPTAFEVNRSAEFHRNIGMENIKNVVRLPLEPGGPSDREIEAEERYQEDHGEQDRLDAAETERVFLDENPELTPPNPTPMSRAWWQKTSTKVKVATGSAGLVVATMLLFGVGNVGMGPDVEGLLDTPLDPAASPQVPAQEGVASQSEDAPPTGATQTDEQSPQEPASAAAAVPDPADQTRDLAWYYAQDIATATAALQEIKNCEELTPIWEGFSGQIGVDKTNKEMVDMALALDDIAYGLRQGLGC